MHVRVREKPRDDESLATDHDTCHFFHFRFALYRHLIAAQPELTHLIEGVNGVNCLAYQDVFWLS